MNKQNKRKLYTFMFIIQQFQCLAYVNNDCYLWLVCYCQSFHKCVSSCVLF